MIWRKLLPSRYETFQRIIRFDIRKLTTGNIYRKDHYEVLGLSKDATQTEIKNAYFELSKQYHPDRIEATDENLAKFRAISDAYEILGNEQARKLYDRGLLRDSVKDEIGAEDLTDPIIKFYKERQQRGRELGKSDNWTEDYYKTVRKAVFDKNEMYRYTTKESKEVSTLPAELYIGAVVAMMVIIMKSYMENHPVNKAWNDILKYAGIS